MRSAATRPPSQVLRAAEHVARLNGVVRLPAFCSSTNPLGNALIQGENLAVLSQLTGVLKESVSCVYIDPPYNNNESYTHYEDRWCRSDWLDGLTARLRLLRSLLTPDGSLWVSIDDAEVHRVRLAAEDIFGPENFVSTIIWNHRKSRENRKVFSNNHEYILCFAKNASLFKSKRNGLAATPEILARYKNPDNDPRGPWQSVSANVQAGHATQAQFYTITSPSGVNFEPPKGRCWAYNKLRMDREIALGNVYFGKRGTSTPRVKKFLSDARLSVTPHTLWTADEVGTTEQAKKHLMSVLHAQDVFDTPKPEELIHRVLAIATDPGDIVLDAYLGSGTTASVAHKMGRAYVGIEQGEHVLTHCTTRLRAVIAGEAGGASSLVGWKGGGGFDTFSFKGK